jgi:hypothetical protein
LSYIEQALNKFQWTALLPTIEFYERLEFLGQLNKTEDGIPCSNGVSFLDRLGKVMFSLCLIIYELRHGDVRVCGNGIIVPTMLTSIPHEEEWPVSRPCHFTPREKFPAHWKGD